MRVHSELDHILVPCSHGGGTHYRISKCEVLWSAGSTPRLAYTIFMQYGNTANWSSAKRNREIHFRKTPHILAEDLDDVLKAIRELKSKRQP